MQPIASLNDKADTSTMSLLSLRSFNENLIFFCYLPTWSAALLVRYICGVASVTKVTKHHYIFEALRLLPFFFCTLYIFFLRMLQNSTEISNDRRLESTSDDVKKPGHEVPLPPKFEKK